MCLSTAYLNKKEEDKVAARYVAKVEVESGKVRLTDIMGTETVIEGEVSFVDLTGGTVVIKTDAA